MQRRRSVTANIDWITVGLYTLLVFIGIVTIYSADYSEHYPSILNPIKTYGKQIRWFGISAIVAFILLLIDGKFYLVSSYALYVLAIGLLILVLIIGEEVKGATSWIRIGGFSIQPSELAKSATLLALAKLLSNYKSTLKKNSFLLKALAIIAIPFALNIAQGDTGSALVFLSFILVLYRFGLRGEYVVAILLIGVVSFFALLINKFILVAIVIVIALLIMWWRRKQKSGRLMLIVITTILVGNILAIDYTFNEILQPHQRERINVMLGKAGDDWNIRQSKIAIGSGGFIGKGYMKGTQTKLNFLPEKHTDFIFCAYAEERGFIGSLVLIAAYLSLIWRVLFLAERQRSMFSQVYGYGVAAILLFHFVINIGMTLGLAPVIGIPLPFISYGGSALLGFTILLFVFVKLDAQRLDVLR